MRKTILMLVVLSLILPSAAFAKKKKKKKKAVEEPAPAAVDDGATMEEDILRFLQLSGGLEGADVMLTTMVDSFRQMHPDVAPELWDQFLAEVDLEEFSMLIVPIYSRHFTHDEIRDAIAFYESPTGKKFAELAPTLTTEGMEVGRAWGMELAERAMEVVRQEAEGAE
ncbi:MAG: DUF2059 domain-containing protein [Proteobacteria bacterium]|nr:DUF2059 domain-containing protein [Pseudomonadota bacterium]